jgi:DinB superfamily
MEDRTATEHVPLDWTFELIDQLAFPWDHFLRPRLATLRDDQYLWEPVAGMWSIRHRGDATSTHATGAGDTVIDFGLPEPSPPPLTTIAWRLGHIAHVFGERAANHFGGDRVGYDTVDWPLTAAGGVDLVDRHHDAWIAGVRALDAEGLTRACGPAEGPFAEYPMATLVLHIHREALHHGAEVALMMDLFDRRGQLGGDR